LKPFLPKLKTRIYANAGDISARPRNTRHKAILDWSANDRDNRDRGGCLFEREDIPGLIAKNNIWIASSGFAREFRVTIESPFLRKPFDDEVVSLDVAELAKFVKELAPILKRSAIRAAPP
jgi:hypothetical protein